MRAKIATPRSVRQAQRRSMAAMLGVEEQALRALRAVVEQAVRESAHRPLGAMVAAQSLASALVPIIVAIRQAARVASRKTLRGEFAQIQRQARRYGVTLPDLTAPSTHAETGAGAGTIALNYGQALIEQSEEATLPTAAQAIDYRLETIAATETARSFAEDRVMVQADYANRYGDARWFPALLKEWDATMDRRTCGTCGDLDGQIRIWGMDFDGGQVPGHVHARCRCIPATLFLPLYLGRQEQLMTEAA